MDVMSEPKDSSGTLQYKVVLLQGLRSYRADHELPDGVIMEAGKKMMKETLGTASSDYAAEDAAVAAEENVAESSIEVTEAALANLSFKEHLSHFKEGETEESITQNAGTASSHGDVGDMNKKDALEVTDPAEEAAEAVPLTEEAAHTEAVVTRALLEQVVEAAANEPIGGSQYSESLARLTEAGSIPQASLHRIDAELDEMMAMAFNKPVDEIKASPLFTILKVFSRQAAENYLSSRNTPERLEKHEAKIAFFRGASSGPDPPPHSVLESIGFSSFNPLYDEMWLPWSREMQFFDHRELGMLIGNQVGAARGLHARHIGLLLSFAIPSRQVLEYMVQRAPEAKIAELGAGSGYWAALLQQLGADIVAVDNASEIIYSRHVFFPDLIKQDGTKFLKSGGADGRALFLCWPRKQQENPAVSSFLENYSGNTIFFVGEINDGCTFDMLQWASENKDKGWEVEEMFDIPTWPGLHDVFLCISKKVAERPVVSG